ncbi:hypothetical protein TWF730_004695 [Orbilia blumenaviensis]|uniref:Uncharacterized protein n=1 Tax=Orbilia blumenaviensis TaxID=1796055 RepID=A0AAV9TW32_9PEZI
MLMHRVESSNPFLARRQDSMTPVRGACPNGGQWYACSAQTSGFVGCCTSNPCTSTGCVAGNLRGASLGDIPFNTTPDQSCLAGGDFYTCVGPPPFWGCCKSNPCASGVGCPQSDLLPASLIANADNPFKTPSATQSSSPSNGGDDDDGTPTGAIVGGVVGGVLGLALICVLIWYLRRKKQTDKTEAPTVPMAFNPHSQQADPASNVPLTYPEVVDHYAGTSPQPTKQNFPPSAFTSPALPQYSDRRASHELGGGGAYNPGYISPMNSPGFQDHQQGSRPMSYELHGTGSPGMPPKASMHAPSIMSTAVSELPAEDMRFSQVSSNMRYSGQPPSSPPPPPPNNEGSGAGLGLTMPGSSEERPTN